MKSLSAARRSREPTAPRGVAPFALALASLLACVAGPGCATSGVAVTPSPLSQAFARPAVVAVPENGGSEEVLSLPRGALTSEAALLHADADELCFDVKMRTWQGAARRYKVSLLVDGRELTERETDLGACTPGSLEPDEPARQSLSCLAVDSALGALTTDTLDAVKVRGSRVCLRHNGALTKESKEIRLDLAQGAAVFSFRWKLAGPEAPPETAGAASDRVARAHGAGR